MPDQYLRHPVADFILEALQSLGGNASKNIIDEIFADTPIDISNEQAHIFIIISQQS